MNLMVVSYKVTWDQKLILARLSSITSLTMVSRQGEKKEGGREGEREREGEGREREGGGGRKRERERERYVW